MQNQHLRNINVTCKDCRMKDNIDNTKSYIWKMKADIGVWVAFLSAHPDCDPHTFVSNLVEATKQITQDEMRAYFKAWLETWVAVETCGRYYFDIPVNELKWLEDERWCLPKK